MRIKKDNRDLKKFTYSIRITTEQKQLLKNNPWIKRELDELVRNHLKIYTE